jgi:hypothetical protein
MIPTSVPYEILSYSGATPPTQIDSENIAVEKAEAEAALEEAIPALEEAAAALQDLRKEDITEIRSFAKPHMLVQKVGEERVGTNGEGWYMCYTVYFANCPLGNSAPSLAPPAISSLLQILHCSQTPALMALSLPLLLPPSLPPRCASASWSCAASRT